MTMPIHILSLGAGVQSSTLALMAAAGEVTPMPAAAIFADTQAEPASVYRWLEWLTPKLPFPVHIVTAGSLEADTLKLRARKDGKGFYIHSGIPYYSLNADGSHGHGPRQCTHHFKITPIHRKQRELVSDRLPAWKKLHKAACKKMSLWRTASAAAKRNKAPLPLRPNEAWAELQQDALIEVSIGISTDEATRQKDSRVDYIRHRWPLLEIGMSRKGCLRWMESRGLPRPPKSACVFCPYHSDDEWLRLKTEEPDEFARAVRFDAEYRRLKIQTVHKTGFAPYLHDSRVPLDQVKFEPTRPDRQLNLFANECEGMCGV